MPGGITLIENGTVTSPQGFVAGATFAGLKTYAEDKLDLAILYSQRPTTVAGVFTQNKLKSPSVILTEERVANGTAHAVVVNSGIANACVGEPGYGDAQRMTAKTAEHLGINPQDVLICSTGIVGVELPIVPHRKRHRRIQLANDGGNRMARAILTTDPGPRRSAPPSP